MAAKSPTHAAGEAAQSAPEAVQSAASDYAEKTRAGRAEKRAQEADGWREAAAAQLKGARLPKDAAGYLADQLSNAASAVRDKDLSGIRSDAEAFAQRHPLMFFGAAALAGFALGRALKATEAVERPTGPDEANEDSPTRVQAYRGKAREIKKAP